MLTISVALAVFFASSGIESLRIGLNRAYGMAETRYWFRAAPGIDRLRAARRGCAAGDGVPDRARTAAVRDRAQISRRRCAPFEWNITVARYAVASAVLIIALVVAHKWLPAGRRKFAEIAPGIVATLVLWLAGGMVFGRYLAEFPNIYVSYYAGLASVMIALVFLYLTASIFVFGGELNAAILRARLKPIEETAPAPAQ